MVLRVLKVEGGCTQVQLAVMRVSRDAFWENVSRSPAEWHATVHRNVIDHNVPLNLQMAS